MFFIKPLSKLLTCIISAIKTNLQSYCDTSYFKGGVNQIFIMRNSNDLLDYGTFNQSLSTHAIVFIRKD